MARTISSHKGENNGNYKHGGRHTRLYAIWCSMKTRCYCPNVRAYRYYGGRGITICSEWLNDYISFRNWAMSNGYKEGLTIDRIDNDGNYEPSNCRWTTRKEQANNQRTTIKIEYKGEKKSLHEWAETLNINPHTLYFRIFRQNWSIERAFNEEVSLNKFDRHMKGGESDA